ncbi:MAG: CPBP family intramembrane metalloprotease [Spirochaetaceae bacterium]|nr:MAG: CPBP family intramembrane metalloprotease [Spirochaetaceae bacterium]
MTAAVILTTFTFGFLIYFFAGSTPPVQTLATRVASRLTSRAEGRGGSFTEVRQETTVYLEKSIGFVTLGLVPALVSLALPGGVPRLGLSLPGGSPWWTVAPVVGFLVLVMIRPRGRVNTDFYPQVRALRWDRARIVRNSFFWILYLVAYEFIFRGFLFFPLIPVMGLEATVAVNCALYALAHLYKGAGEAFGAFFLGILLCAIAYATGSFLVPLVVHIILALGNDYLAVAVSPERTFSR